MRGMFFVEAPYFRFFSTGEFFLQVKKYGASILPQDDQARTPLPFTHPKDRHVSKISTAVLRPASGKNTTSSKISVRIQGVHSQKKKNMGWAIIFASKGSEKGVSFRALPVRFKVDLEFIFCLYLAANLSHSKKSQRHVGSAFT